MAVRRSRAEWAEVIAKFEASGEPLSQFCAKRRIRARTLTWWRWKLGGEQALTRASESSAIRLIAVDVKAPVPVRSEAELRICVADVDVRVAVGTDVAYVADLVGAIRSRC